MENLAIKVEEKLLSWVVNNRHKLVATVVVCLAAFSLTVLPYINLRVDTVSAFFIAFIFIIEVFQISLDRIIILVIWLFLTALVFTFISEQEKAEMIGNLIYGILLVKVVSAVIRLK